MNKGLKIICLCGSTKFKEAFEKANREETLKGNIVLSVGAFPHCEGDWITKEQKELVDKLHFKKIELADEILILNVGGYIGESTNNEIEYAKSKRKIIRFLERTTNDKTNKTNKEKFKEIIRTAIMTYQNGVDEINEIAFEKAIADKDGIKRITIDAEANKKLAKNRKNAIDYAVKKILSLISEEGEVIAEGKITTKMIDLNAQDWDLPKFDFNKLAKYIGRPIKIIIKEIR